MLPVCLHVKSVRKYTIVVSRITEIILTIKAICMCSSSGGVDGGRQITEKDK